jgi:Asp-tRNA(Asn)/Glu-tRNA(Gln) amidotransferase C subunit
MTKKEIEILDDLARICESINALPPVISKGRDTILEKETVTHINALQRIVLAREGLRQYKKSVTDSLLSAVKNGEMTGQYTPSDRVNPKRQWTRKDTEELKQLQKNGKLENTEDEVPRVRTSKTLVNNLKAWQQSLKNAEKKK